MLDSDIALFFWESWRLVIGRCVYSTHVFSSFFFFLFSLSLFFLSVNDGFSHQLWREELWKANRFPAPVLVYDVLRNGLDFHAPWLLVLSRKVGLEVLRLLFLFFVFLFGDALNQKLKSPCCFSRLLGESERTNRPASPVVPLPYSPGGATTTGCGPVSTLSVSRRVRRAPSRWQPKKFSFFFLLLLLLLLGEGVKRKNINRTKEWKFFSLWLDGRCLAQTATHASTARTHERGKSKLK